MTVSEAVTKLFQSVLNIIPRWCIIPSTHGGVAFVRGRARAIPRGGCLYWYWPFWTELLIVPVVRQTLNLQPQVIMTRPEDGKPRSLAVSAVVVYEINDAVKSWGSVHELDEAIADIALASVKHVLARKTILQVQKDQEEIDKEIAKDLRKKLYDKGVTILNVFLSDAAPCTVLRILGGPAVLPEEWEDED